jgi:hypothetical protein
MTLFQPGANVVASLDGTERVGIDTGGAQVAVTTTGDIAALAAGGGVASKYIYVSNASTSTLTPDGSFAAPFLTVQSAINAATANTSIYIMPGTYSENVVMRDLDGIAIIGSSEVNTIITNATAGHTFSWVPGAVTGALVNKFVMYDIELANTDTVAGAHALHIDANAVVFPDTFCSEEFDMHTVDCEGNGDETDVVAYARNVGNMYWTHGDITGGNLYVTNPSEFITRQVSVGTLLAPMNFVAEYDGNNPHNGLGRSNITISEGSVVYGDLSILGHPILQTDQGSIVLGDVTGTLTSFYASGRDYCPLLSLRADFGIVGGAGGNITLTFPDPQTSGSAFNYVDFSQAHIAGVVTLTKTNFLPATARGIAYVSGTAEFHLGTANSISANGYVALDLRGAIYLQAALQATGAASIDRDVITFVQTISASPTTVPISPPLPTGATYSVAVGPSTATAFSVTSKAVNQFVLTGPASGTADITISRI